MPLPQQIEFKTIIQKGNRLQIPKIIREQFKIEANQVFKVEITRLDYVSNWQSFYAKTGKDGRIFIPEIIQLLLQKEKPPLTGYIYDVIIQPA